MAPKYGTAECKNCYIRLPKPEMYRGLDFFTGTKTRNHYGMRRGGWTRTGYSVSNNSPKLIWRCKKCFRWWLITRSLLAVFAAVAVVAFAVTNARSPRPAAATTHGMGGVAVPAPWVGQPYDDSRENYRKQFHR